MCKCAILQLVEGVDWPLCRCTCSDYIVHVHYTVLCTCMYYTCMVLELCVKEFTHFCRRYFTALWFTPACTCRFAEEDSDDSIMFDVAEEKTPGGGPGHLIKGGTIHKLVERLTYHEYAGVCVCV